MPDVLNCLKVLNKKVFLFQKVLQNLIARIQPSLFTADIHGIALTMSQVWNILVIWNNMAENISETFFIKNMLHAIKVTFLSLWCDKLVDATPQILPHVVFFLRECNWNIFLEFIKSDDLVWGSRVGKSRFFNSSQFYWIVHNFYLVSCRVLTSCNNFYLVSCRVLTSCNNFYWVSCRVFTSCNNFYWVSCRVFTSCNNFYLVSCRVLTSCNNFLSLMIPFLVIVLDIPSISSLFFNFYLYLFCISAYVCMYV